jgi:hypothetical protein
MPKEYSTPALLFLADNGQLFPNLVREGLPTIRELMAISAFKGIDRAATAVTHAREHIGLFAPFDI